jgi:hypothetical protein
VTTVGRDLVLVGNGQGFWGDSMLGPVRLVREGPLDYLTLDYLAEVTMSIMQKARARDPSAGYATDFVKMLERILPECRERGIKIIANAGGVNPRACGEAAVAVAGKLGLSGLRIGVVEGDDILDRLDEFAAAGESFTNLDTGEALGTRRDDVQSANAYLGAQPIVDALAEGADVVITGRCADAALTAAPLIHEFGWAAHEYDRLSSAMIGGHIIECGTQCTGGNFEGWRSVPDFDNIGYPVLEARPDGSFVVTKHDHTGGLVNMDTVIAQLLYEIGDPCRYITPDVIVDFTSVQLHDAGPNRVLVDGARGAAPTDTYKVSMTMHDGYKGVGQLTVVGPDAVEKAKLTASLLFSRLAREGVRFAESQQLVECIGAGACVDDRPGAFAEPPEVVLRIAVRDADRRRIDRWGMELASLLLSGPPGLTGFAGGRPKASEVLAHWPALVDRSRVLATVTVEEVQ